MSEVFKIVNCNIHKIFSHRFCGLSRCKSEKFPNLRELKINQLSLINHQL